MFFFHPKSRGKKKIENHLLPTYSYRRPSHLYVSARKKKLSPFGHHKDIYTTESDNNSHMKIAIYFGQMILQKSNEIPEVVQPVGRTKGSHLTLKPPTRIKRLLSITGSRSKPPTSPVRPHRMGQNQT